MLTSGVENLLGQALLLVGAGLAFHDDHARRLVGAVLVVGHARVLAGVFGPAAHNLHGDYAVGGGHGVLVLAELALVLVPLHGRERPSAQAAQQFASVALLHDTRTQEEREAGGAFLLFLPVGVRKRLASADGLQVWFVFRNHRW